MIEVNNEHHKICRENAKYSKVSEIVKNIDYLVIR
jgi:hypothetical protein